MAKVLVVDDEALQRRIVSDILKSEKHTVIQADSAEAAPRAYP